MIRRGAPFEQHRCTLSSFSADVILYQLGLLFVRSFNAGLHYFRGPVWLFVRGSFCICSAFCSFFVTLSMQGFLIFVVLFVKFVRGSFGTCSRFLSFSFASSLQGFLIFVFHVLLSREVRRVYQLKKQQRQAHALQPQPTAPAWG